MYTHLAHLYEAQGADEFVPILLPLLRDALTRGGVQPGARLLELGAGTALLSEALASSGFEVVGLELSEAMLAEASRQGRDSATLVQGDMRSYPAGPLFESGRFDAVCCVFDGFNHLTSTFDLQRALREAARVLRPGGVLLFDVNTQETYETLWQGGDELSGPDWEVVSEGEYDPRTRTAVARYEARDFSRGEFAFLEDEVTQRFHDVPEIEAALRDAGFVDAGYERFDPFGPLDDDAPCKQWWEARRP